MQFETGTVVKGKITRITNFGAFVAIDGGGVGMIHISEVSNGFVKEIKEFLSEGQEVEALVISCDENGKTGLSMRRIKPKYPDGKAPADFFSANEQKEQSFEEMMHKFKQISDDKISDLKRGYDSKRGSGVKKR